MNRSDQPSKLISPTVTPKPKPISLVNIPASSDTSTKKPLSFLSNLLPSSLSIFLRSLTLSNPIPIDFIVLFNK